MSMNHCDGVLPPPPCDRPLYRAAIIGNIENYLNILRNGTWSPAEQINALELLGATYVDKKHDLSWALMLWKMAMICRWEHPPIEKPKKRSPMSSYFNTNEVCTISQLEEISADPDKIKTQALLIRERILGQFDNENLFYIKKRGALYASVGNFERCIGLWSYILLSLQNHYQLPNARTQHMIKLFIQLFSHMISKKIADPRGYPTTSFLFVIPVFGRAVNEVEALFSCTHQSYSTRKKEYCLLTVMQYIGVVCMLQPYLRESQDLRLKREVHRLVRLNPRARNGWTPLHLACFEKLPINRYFQVSFSTPDVIKLLLEVGACPNERDLDLNSPLHIAASNKLLGQDAFKALLNHGAHLDLRNKEGKTPLQLAQDISLLGICPLKYLSLQCLSAQAVRLHGIEYKGCVHESLEEFLDNH